jgi:diaminopimelate decarboxylase
MAPSSSSPSPAQLEEAERTRQLIERSFDVRQGQLIVGGLSVRELADRFGTPLFVYDERLLSRQLTALRQTLPKRFDVFYSVKANPNQAILRCFVGEGCGLEIASRGELFQALAAGCPAERILFAGPGKTEAELALALDRSIGEIHVESLTEARRLARLASERGRVAKIALRVNPAGDVEGGAMRMGGRAAPFGIDEDQLPEVVEAIRNEPSLEIAGLHLFVGTQILDHRILLTQYRAGVEIARRLAETIGRPLQTLDFGGGLGVPYFAGEHPLDLAALRDGLQSLVDELEGDSLLGETRFILEPGRFLVAECGVYVARVTDVKTSRGKKFAILDGGMHHHLAASGNLGQMIKRNFPLAVANKLGEEAREVVDVVGPLCTPLDTLGRGLLLPPVEIGDLVAIFQSGAYARAASPLGFLSHPSPPEVLVTSGDAQLVRERSSDDLWLADQPKASAHDVQSAQ